MGFVFGDKEVRDGTKKKRKKFGVAARLLSLSTSG
jgi:hypothetical protein